MKKHVKKKQYVPPLENLMPTPNGRRRRKKKTEKKKKMMMKKKKKREMRKRCISVCLKLFLGCFDWRMHFGRDC